MSCWRGTGLASLAAAAASGGGGALAQPMLAPSPSVACLVATPGSPPLLYPPELLRRKDGGMVKVELRFQAADQAPKVNVLNEDRQTLGKLEDAVREHVVHLRVPCMAAGSPEVVLRRDYVFVPNDGRKVVASQPRDQADLALSEQLACITHVKGLKRPDYPTLALRDDKQGNVYVRLRFEAPDQAPKLGVLAASRHTALVAAVRDYAAGLRLPCLGSQPVEPTQLFMFKIDGGARTVLNDFSLVQMVGAARDLPAGVYFDLNTMQCPFSLRLSYFRPHGPNEVRSLDTHYPARQAFMDWLSQITLNLPDVRNTEVLGQTITVEVPCGTVDL